MKKFEGYLIVSDLDGTFLGKQSRIVERNVEAVRYFTENGGLFTFATGRAFYNARIRAEHGGLCQHHGYYRKRYGSVRPCEG